MRLSEDVHEMHDGDRQRPGAVGANWGYQSQQNRVCTSISHSRQRKVGGIPSSHPALGER